MRLIDADKLKIYVAAAVLDGNKEHKDRGSALFRAIDSMPTAYDVDKVVEHLEEKREKHRKDAHAQMYKHKHKDWAQYLDGMQCGIRDSIEIVKSGGIE